MTLLKQWQDAHARACRERNEAEDQAKATLDTAEALRVALGLALNERDEAREKVNQLRHTETEIATLRKAVADLHNGLGLALAERDEARQELERTRKLRDAWARSRIAATERESELRDAWARSRIAATERESKLEDTLGLALAERDEAREKLQRAECAIDQERESAKAAKAAYFAKCEALGRTRAALATMRDALRDACRDRGRSCVALDNAHAVLTAAKGDTI